MMENDTMLTRKSPSYLRHERYWIPSDHVPAQRFYVDRLHVPHSRRDFLRGALARSVAGRIRDPLSWLVAPNGHATGRSNGPADPQELLRMQELVRMMEESLHRAGVIGRGALSCVALEDDHRSARGQLLLFLFEAGGAHPCAVAKLTAQPSRQAVLQHEFATLSAVRPRLTEPLRSTLPRPILLTERSGLMMLVETYMPGRSIYVELRGRWQPRRLAQRHFRLARIWLAQFQRETRSAAVRLDELLRHDAVQAPLEQFRQRCRPSPREEQMIRHVLEAAQHLRWQRLPLVVRQGDFWPRNLLVNDHTVGVVDWERTRPGSPPFADLLMFATTYGLSFPWQWGAWADPLAAFSATYLERTWLSQLIRATVLAYCRDMELSPAWLEVFFPMFLIEQTLSEQGQQAPEARSAVAGMWRRVVEQYADHGGSVCFT